MTEDAPVYLVHELPFGDVERITTACVSVARCIVVVTNLADTYNRPLHPDVLNGLEDAQLLLTGLLDAATREANSHDR